MEETVIGPKKCMMRVLFGIDPGINFIFLKANKDLLSLAKLFNYKTEQIKSELDK